MACRGNKTQVGSFEDALGSDVIVGDYIVYGYLVGRCAAVKFGKVLDIYKTTVQAHNGPRDDYSIKVIGASRGWGKDFKLGSKCGHVRFPERVAKANRIIPPDLMDLLDSYESYESNKSNKK
jgi:hypothetical protein